MVQQHTTVLRPQVGVGVLIWQAGHILLGQRAGAHGAGSWATPGGHLEFGESLFNCAAREVAEETGLALTDLRPGPYTNNVFSEAQKHYLTVFVWARSAGGKPQRKEPDKCMGWQWFAWAAPHTWPQPLFLPLQSLGQQQVCCPYE